MALTQAEINANRKKVGINPLIKTQNEKELIPFKLESNAVDKNSWVKDSSQDKKKQDCIAKGGFWNTALNACQFADRTESTLAQEQSNLAETAQANKEAYDNSPEWRAKANLRRDLETKKNRLTEDTASMEETIRLNKEQLKNDNLAFQEQQKATQAGVGATFSESRLGASTSSAGQASQVAQEGIARQTETFSNQLQQNSLNLSNLERSLVRAQEDGDTEAQDAILAQVDAIQQENLDIQAWLEDTQTAQRDELLSTIKTLGGETFGWMSSEKVGALFENAGLGYGLGVGYQASQAKLAEAMQGKDETAIQQAQANLQKTQLEIDNFGKSKTDTALAGITTLKSALASGSIDQTAYDNLSAELWFAPSETDRLNNLAKQADIDYKNAQTDTERATASEQYDTYTGMQATGSEVMNNVYNSVDGESGGQCGRYANNMLGSPWFFWDYLEDRNWVRGKRSRINSQIPTAWSAFISSLDSGGGYGHVGMVEEVLDDGRLVVVDSNRYDGNEKINRRTIDPTSEQIVGYYNPIKDSKQSTGNNVNQLLDRYALASTPSAKDKIVAEATKKGLFEQFNDGLANNLIADPTSKNILAASGLSPSGFMAATGKLSQLPRGAARTRALDEMAAWAKERDIDTSTFASEYEAFNEVVKRNIKISALVGLSGADIGGSLSELTRLTETEWFGDVKIANITKILAGEEVGDPVALQYKFILEDLRSAVSTFFAVQQGRTSTELSDREDAKQLINNGLASGSISGLISTIDTVSKRTERIADDSVELAQNQIWEMFGVKKPSEVADNASNKYSEENVEADNIANKYELNTPTPNTWFGVTIELP